MYLKVREDGRVRSEGVMIAVGINADGCLLGMMVGDTESETERRVIMKENTSLHIEAAIELPSALLRE